MRVKKGEKNLRDFIIRLELFFFGNWVKGEDELCDDFFAYNRAKGTLFDGETRLFLRNSGNYAFTVLLLLFMENKF